MKEFDRELFRQRLRERRKKLGMTQVELGDACGFLAGAEISHYENGIRIPNIAHLFMLADALSIDVYYLVGMDE